MSHTIFNRPQEEVALLRTSLAETTTKVAEMTKKLKHSEGMNGKLKQLAIKSKKELTEMTNKVIFKCYYFPGLVGKP